MKEETLITEDPADPPSCSHEADEPPLTSSQSFRLKFYPDVSDAQWNDWHWHFKNRITSIEDLIRFIPMSVKEKTRLKLVTARFPLAITPYYLSLMDLSDPNDPVRLQAVPSTLETAAGTGNEDPLAEERDSVVPGLVHRYPDRVLMVLTDICAMLCRHCTRKREWQHGGWIHTPEQVERMLDYIRKNPQIRDVIISGGDPLTLSTHQLEKVLIALRQIKHVEIIRIGTRFPVVLPQRIDEELCAMLSKYGPIWLNTHFNHVNEITPEAAAACDRLLRAGVQVNNQSVLLRSINDTVESQLKLCHGLLKAKVRPYYLFQCDQVQGTEHLWTPVEVGLRIIEGMRGHTSGLAIPNYVIDLPDGRGKIPMTPNYVLTRTDSELVVRNYEGHISHFANPKPAPAPRKPRPVSPPVPQLSLDWTVTEVKNENRAGVRP
ncbi:lysine 2,3-aminomutase [Dehalogenimonas formicexedens]|uniref:Lysine 2,3-aminomutase n=1 Tax=Dehalogenimonas formicexedens TaxID=1839801 RepID=A0A1P8F7Q0_9CHLR|nr:KamA family radical SAM protein [Dehalogenimonas formicexedens]APV44402.1 lysine 2,3-aminomutase [Dehalogenimonas formicexedens]